MDEDLHLRERFRGFPLGPLDVPGYMVETFDGVRHLNPACGRAPGRVDTMAPVDVFSRPCPICEHHATPALLELRWWRNILVSAANLRELVEVADGEPLDAALRGLLLTACTWTASRALTEDFFGWRFLTPELLEAIRPLVDTGRMLLATPATLSRLDLVNLGVAAAEAGRFPSRVSSEEVASGLLALPPNVAPEGVRTLLTALWPDAFESHLVRLSPGWENDTNDLCSVILRGLAQVVSSADSGRDLVAVVPRLALAAVSSLFVQDAGPLLSGDDMAVFETFAVLAAEMYGPTGLSGAGEPEPAELLAVARTLTTRVVSPSTPSPSGHDDGGA